MALETVRPIKQKHFPHWLTSLRARSGDAQEAPEGVLLAEIGSLSLEFTRLSQLSGNPKWFDAIQRIYDVFEAQQSLTKLPGMWPLVVNARDLNFTEGGTFTLGAMADSTYEYLPKVCDTYRIESISN
jgi:mannosyl-oligosaccharide alpha-1,2-mannosidase